MENFIEKYRQGVIEKINALRSFPNFQVGDTIIVKSKSADTSVQRVQSFQGVVIRKKNRSISSSFTVRKISHGEGVNKNFMYYSPNILNIEIVRHGKVRRAKLYYITKLKGKAARVKERIISTKSSQEKIKNT